MKTEKAKVKLKVSSASTATMMMIAWIIMGLIIVQFLMHVFRGERTFLAQELYGFEIKLDPKTQPNVTSQGLLRWASLATTSIYSVNFLEYEEQVESLKGFFTEKGFKVFRKSYEEGILEGVIEKKLIVSSVVNGPPVVLREFYQQKKGKLWKVEPRQAWIVQVPILATYQGASLASTSKQMLVSLLIVRDSKSSQGIAIEEVKEQSFSFG